MTAARCPECRTKMHPEQDFCPNFLNHRDPSLAKARGNEEAKTE